MSASEFEGIVGAMQTLQSAGIGLTLVVTVMLTYLVGDVLRRLGSEEGALIPLEGLVLGSTAPDVEMTGLRTGERFRVSDLQGKRSMIAFVSGTCRPCHDLLPHINELALATPDTQFIVVADARSKDLVLSEIGSAVTIVEDGVDWPIGSAFEVRMSPLVYVLDADGRVMIRAVPITRLNLEDALDGSGHLQRSAWTPVKALS